MSVAQCRKALVAFLGTAVSAYVAAWAQNQGVLPGWSTVAMAVGLGVPAALVVFGVPNARAPLPKRYAVPSVPGLAASNTSAVARMDARTATRLAAQEAARQESTSR